MEKRARVINLHCDVCGTEIMVSASGDYKWHPIYCCGLEIHGVEGTITQPSKKKPLPSTRKRVAATTAAVGKKKLAVRKSSAKVKTGVTGKKKAAGKRTLPKPKKK